MGCHALGRCRICAKKHKLRIFGSEENQHALIEKIHLQLIVLNTVCIDCIAKFEQVVKKSASSAAFETHPAMQQFYIDEFANGKLPGKISSAVCGNERSKPRDDSARDPEAKMTSTSCTRKRPMTNDDAETRSSTIKSKERKAAAAAKRTKIQCQRLRCDFCSKEFTHRGDLKRHKRKHTGEKPYECPECRKTFSQLSNLTRHRLVHSGERPFACAECGQSYSRKGRLANHIGRQLCRRKRRSTARSASPANKLIPG